MSIEKVKIIGIHPQNSSYPILTAKASEMNLNFDMHQDHDHYIGFMSDFSVFDNTSYPYTLDPTINYEKGSLIDS
jgi:hypothetical protein